MLSVCHSESFYLLRRTNFTNKQSCLRNFIFFSAPQDNSSPDDQIQIQLVSVPMYGILTRSQSQQEPQELREYSSFTMEDINKQRVR